MSEAKQKLVDEGERFVQFAPILDAIGRKYLVMWLQEKLLSDEYFDYPVKSDYLRHFAHSLERIFDSEDLQSLLQRQPMFGQRLFTETLHWLRHTFRSIEKKHPYETEAEHLDGWSVRPEDNLKTQWNYLIRDAEMYTEARADFSYHRNKLKQALDSASFNRVIDDVFSLWDADLQGRILEYQLQQWEENVDDFKDNLDQKVEEMTEVEKIVGPYIDFLDPDWNLENQALEDTGYDVLETYHEWLKQEDSLRELADLLGRLRKAGIETDEDIYEQKLLRREEIRDPTLRSEIDGLHLGKELSHMLPTETVLFSDGDTEWQFYKKYAEEKLLQYQFRDRRFITNTDVLQRSEEKTKRKQKGPFIVCVDTSGSMEGEPERLAKVLCFGILKMAARENRRAFLINFSTGIQTIDLQNIAANLNELIRFLRLSFHGGTDLSLALAKTLEMLETNEYREADVLVISDFVMYRLSENIQQKMKRQQQHFDTRFHCMVIADQADEQQLNIFDQAWLYNPDEKGIYREIDHAMRTMR